MTTCSITVVEQYFSLYFSEAAPTCCELHLARLWLLVHQLGTWITSWTEQLMAQMVQQCKNQLVANMLYCR